VTEELIITTLQSFVLEKFPLARKKAIKRDSPLLQSGIVDSLGVLELVQFLEREFSIGVNDEELIPENFANIQALASFITAKLPANVEGAAGVVATRI
jgi:acyl carrier protein